MSPITDDLITQMTRKIVEAVNPRKIVLFGSQARGDAGVSSDIDVLVIEDEPFGHVRSRRKEMARLWAALSGVPVAKDILVYTFDEVERWKDSRNHVVAHALKHGRILYERN
jgi:uncharacterized protein